MCVYYKMVCPACLAVLPLTLGIGITFTNAYYVGLLVTLISVFVYLYYMELKKCDQCIES